MELSTGLEFIRTQRGGVLTTIKTDGRPQLSNITYHLADDGTILISVTAPRAKTHNMRRDPRVSLHVTRPDFWSYAVIEATAELTPVAQQVDDAAVEQLVAYYRAAAGEHPDWDEYRQTMVADQRLLAILHPDRAYGMLR